MRKLEWVNFLFITGIVLGIPGCQITIPPPGTGGDEPSGGGDGGGPVDQVPVVSLQASNTTPQPNETIQLQCSVTAGGGETIRYTFQPTFGRLTVDENSGRANFIVTDTDVGVTLRFTCTAQNEAGTSAPSNEVVITPSAPP